MKNKNKTTTKIFSLLIILFVFTNQTKAGTYTVSTNADAGAGSLRTAITSANASVGADIINFTIGTATITLASALPALSGAGVTINGNTATGYVANTNATWPGSLNGTLAVTINGNDLYQGITISSDNNVIRGLNFINMGPVASALSNVMIYITSGDNNQILGCYIGTDVNGTTSGGANTGNGVRILDGANNKIGDGTAAGRNLISGLYTGGRAIMIEGNAATGNTVKGNIIGLQKDGATYLATNQNVGVYIYNLAANNTIGGTTAGAGNVISGTNSSGVFLWSSAAAGNTVLGNIIGPQANGTSNVASSDQNYGVFIQNSPNNTIGGTAALAKNIISANTSEGIYITGATSTGNVVKGNYIGLDQNGTAFITGSDQDHGVQITTDASSNVIGGTAAGEGNVISGNTIRGIYNTSTAAGGNSVFGNIIGPQANGTSYVSNDQDYGIQIVDSPNNIIGGTTSGARNIISANLTAGIHILNAGATGNLVKGNYLGLDQNGTTFIAGSSQNYGVLFTASAASNTIGGTVAGAGNVISGNTLMGIYSTSAAGNSILGNIIGPQANGTSNVASNAQTQGVYLNGSPNNTIGGNTAGARNIISANLTYGVYISLAGGTGNVVKGNYIGPSSALAGIAISSQDYGVYIDGSAASNIIGGSAAGEANTIAFNTTQGVYLSGASTDFNLISRNPIYNNGTPIGTGKPINLNYNGGSNNNKAVPVITTANTTTVIGTSVAGDIVEVFKNSTGNCNDAVTFVGSATANGMGNWSLLPVGVTASDYVFATATDGSNNTSEFIPCVVPLPVELLLFDAKCLPAQAGKNDVIQLSWTTASETNNNFFTIERSAQPLLPARPAGGNPPIQGGLEFVLIGTVKGAGNSSTIRKYEFVDAEVPLSAAATQYYRLKQTDYNGKYEYFSPVAVRCNTSDIAIYPTISAGFFFITGISDNAEVTVYSVSGQKIYSPIYRDGDGLIDLSAQPQGIYVIQIKTEKESYTQKLIIQQ